MAVATVCISGINDWSVISAFVREKKAELMIRRETGTVLSAVKGDIWKFIHENFTSCTVKLLTLKLDRRQCLKNKK